ncbi:hypothetical protein PCANC_20796 [Puccinia coronata f. sp. avenae]|uniref:Uncharacterized protein n=1 Tax=Puccinia coronata f. sp. avenae TaxID=200324 RepID=A0A2N5U854_9BASI|nr:hypothetical protein PCANC_20796 [Puccinia coronata f. sp. avenae]
MPAFPRQRDPADDPKGKNGANSTFNMSGPVETEISANPFSNSMSPLTVGDATELEDNPSSILSSSPTRLPSVPTEPSEAGVVILPNLRLPPEIDDTVTTLENTTAPDVDISIDDSGARISQTTPDLESLLDSSSSDDTSSKTTPHGVAPSPNTSSAAWSEMRQASDQSNQVQNTHTTHTATEAQLPSWNTSSSLSLSQADLNSSKTGSKLPDSSDFPSHSDSSETGGYESAQHYKPTPRPDSISSLFGASTTSSPKKAASTFGQQASDESYDENKHLPYVTSTAHITSSGSRQQSSNSSKTGSKSPDSSDFPSHYDSSETGGYESAQHHKPTPQPDSISSLFGASTTSSPEKAASPFGKQAGNESYDENKHSPYVTSTAHITSTGSRQQSSTSSSEVNSTPLPVSSSEEATKNSSRNPPEVSTSSTEEMSYPGTISKSPTSKLPSSNTKTEHKPNYVPSIIPDLNDTMSNLTSLNSIYPCQIPMDSKESTAQSMPETGCFNASGFYSANQTSVGNLRIPSALQQKDTSSDGTSTIGDLEKHTPFPLDGGGSNTGKDNHRVNPTLAEVPDSQHRTDFGGASGRASSWNSSDHALGRLNKTHPSNKELPPPQASAPLFGDVSILNSSNTSSSVPFLGASSSSSSSEEIQESENQSRASTFSESKGPSNGSGGRSVQVSQQESDAKEDNFNEWRISVQNSSSGFSAQRLGKDTNSTHSQLLDYTRAGNQNNTQARVTTAHHAESEEEKSTRSSAETDISNSTDASSNSAGTEKSSKAPEKSLSTSWIGQSLLPSSAPGPEQGYHVGSGGKITAISVGLCFSVGVLVLALVGGLMKRKLMKKNRPAGFAISQPTSQSAEDFESSFSSYLGSQMGDGRHSPNASLDPQYQVSGEEESGVDPFRTSYDRDPDSPRNRYESFGSSFGNFRQHGFDLVRYPGPSSHPHDYVGPEHRRSDGTTVIPISFNHSHDQQRMGALDFETEYYGRPEVLPHSGVPWYPDQQQSHNDYETEVGTRFSDGETMIEDMPPNPFSNRDHMPPVPPLTSLHHDGR